MMHTCVMMTNDLGTIPAELAGWGIAAVSPDNFVRILCGPVTCDTSRAAITLLSSLVLLKRRDGLIPSVSVVNVFTFCKNQETPHELPWVSPMPDQRRF